MYATDGKDVVVEISDIPGCDPGASLPILVADERRCILAYRCSGQHAALSEDEGFVIFTFDVWAHYFGGPNDEALSGHPLYAAGLRCYGIFQIQNSSWIRQMEARNRVHHLHNSKQFEELRHFAFTFHDSLFECVTRNMRWERWPGSAVNVAAELARRLATT